MATYKIDIVQRQGKYHSAFYEAGGAKPNPADNKPVDTLEDIIKGLEAEISSRNLDEEADTIIFRNIGYEDYTQLTREIRRATY